MSDPLNPSARDKRETAFANQTRPADPGNSPWSNDQYSTDHYLVPEEDVRVVHQERLFSRKVLFGWAFATLLVVFAVTVIIPMVVPIVRETVVSNVMARMKENGMIRNPAAFPAMPVIPEIPAIPAIPAVPAVPSEVDAPAVAGEPAAQAPAAPPAAGATRHHHTKKPAPAATDRR